MTGPQVGRAPGALAVQEWAGLVAVICSLAVGERSLAEAASSPLRGGQERDQKLWADREFHAACTGLVQQRRSRVSCSVQAGRLRTTAPQRR